MTWWRKVRALVREDVEHGIGFRTRLRLRSPLLLELHYTRYPEIIVRPRAEPDHARTPADWKPGEQSDNLNTRHDERRNRRS